MAVKIMLHFQRQQLRVWQIQGARELPIHISIMGVLILKGSTTVMDSSLELLHRLLLDLS